MTMAPARPASAAGAIPAVNRDASAIEVLERVITTGDLAALQPQERVALYARTCESLGLNALTRPFEYITLNSKLTLYVRKDATDQLRRIYRVSIDSLRRELDAEAGLLTFIADGHTPDGRRDQASGTVTIKGLSGEALANASMKAETKSKRRLTLSLVGLGFLDESEVEGGQPVDIDTETGEIKPAKPKPSLLEAVQTQQQRLSAGTPTSEAPAAPAPAAVAPAAPRVVPPSAAPVSDAGDPGPTPPPAKPAPGPASTACDAVDGSQMDLGRCAKPAGHSGAHGNAEGTWPR